jgi:transcriptional regulator with PAS, ATPase and Fis domain
LKFGAVLAGIHAASGLHIGLSLLAVLLHPVTTGVFLNMAQRGVLILNPVESSVSELKERLGLQQFVGESDVLLREIREIPKVARCDASVLICGETGTGKELVARSIHYLSLRGAKPFVPVNCGAIPGELVENELFGHEAGAFTGASCWKPGLIREAEGGTMFLDEIDSLPLRSQVKLLRFLEDKEYRALGSRKVLEANVRVIAASNANFDEAIRNGKFRSDLYYRLNVICFSLPPLRQRKEDIPLLARHLIEKHSAKRRLAAKPLSTDALQRLMSYDWPGNVRELENVIEHALVLADHAVIAAKDIRLPHRASEASEVSFKALKAEAIAEFETSYIRRLLCANNGNITKAASVAKQNRRAFWRLMQKYKISPQGGLPCGDRL